MAHTKAQGSVKGNRDSIAKRLGVKVYSGETLNSYYINRPESGNYTATLSTDENKEYRIDVYLYDEHANVKMKTFKGVLSKNSNNEININFDKLNSENSKINRKRALGLDSLNNFIF